MKTLPITIAVVCYNEEENIKRCLHSLVTQNCKPKRILVIDNDSTDKTVTIVQQFIRKYPYIKLITNKVRSIAKSRNIALFQTKTKFLAFIDADCTAPSHWILSLYNAFSTYQKIHPNLASVGGSNIPPMRNTWYQTLSLFLNSYLGTGTSIQGRMYTHDFEVPHTPCVNVLFQTSSLKKIEGFDESLGNIIEDEDLTLRLAKDGYVFYYKADAHVTHFVAQNDWQWLRKMFVYGKGRAWFIIKHPGKAISLKVIGSLILILTLLFSPVVPLQTILVWGVYLSIVSIASIYICAQQNKTSYIIRLFMLYISTHIIYGLGLLYGLIIDRYQKK